MLFTFRSLSLRDLRFGITKTQTTKTQTPKTQTQKLIPLEIIKKNGILKINSSQSYHLKCFMVTQCSQAATARKNREIYLLQFIAVASGGYKYDFNFTQHYSHSVSSISSVESFQQIPSKYRLLF